MLTLKHFFDRPTWAAVAGYDFNFIDCMSECANRINVFEGIWGLLKETPDIELRSIWVLPFNLAVCALSLFWPFIYPFFAIVLYFKCKRAVRKYPIREKWPEIVEKNITSWMEGFGNK